jgi:hypothetical protein
MSYSNTHSYQAFQKSPLQSVKHKPYFKVYDEVLARFKDKHITFIEVGVLNGGSLFMWRNFFGEGARIIGIDLNPDVIKYREFGFEIYIGDQADPEFWRRLLPTLGEIDILLDDGGHKYIQQVITVKEVIPYIKHNGLIVVEDCHTSYLAGYGPKQMSFVKYVKKMIDSMNMDFNFNKSTQELINPIGGICFYPAMVVLNIDRNKESSEAIFNSGKSDNIQDFRNMKIDASIKLFNIFSKLKLISFIPGLIFIKNFALRLTLKFSRSNKLLKKFFNA